MYIRILKQLGMKLSSGPKPLYSDFPNRPAKREREREPLSHSYDDGSRLSKQSGPEHHAG